MFSTFEYSHFQDLTRSLDTSSVEHLFFTKAEVKKQDSGRERKIQSRTDSALSHHRVISAMLC